MNEQDIRVVSSLLATPKRIAVIPHRSPDGDAMGSTLGMWHFLKKLGHFPTVIAPNDFPDFLRWLPGADTVDIYERDKARGAEILQSAELVFALDFNALHRTGEMESVLSKLSAPFVMIDHHQAPDNFAVVTYSDTAYGSTCEMLFNFIGFLGKNFMIDETIATCIYTGIMTDSGSFRFPSTTPATHRIAAELIERGARNGDIHNAVYDSNTFDSLQLLGRALSKLRILPGGKISYTFLSQADLDEFHYEKGDTEGIVNYGLSISGVIFTAIFIEHTDEKIVKISFRSKGSFDVNKFAREHFSGGGHINAAGGKSQAALEETVRKFVSVASTLQL